MAELSTLGGVIKAAYEGEANTNAFTDSEKSKLEGLADVAISGAYGDLTGTPTLGTAAAADIGDFATAAQGSTADSAVQPGDLATVATSGAYSDLTGTPQGTAVANAVDETDIIDQFNGLLASLRTAGLIAS